MCVILSVVLVDFEFELVKNMWLRLVGMCLMIWLVSLNVSG